MSKTNSPLKQLTQNEKKLSQPIQEPIRFQITAHSELTNLLSMRSQKILTWLSKTKSTHYSMLTLRKKGKSGRLRVIHNPDDLMRLVQYRILTKILDQISVPDYIHAFERNKSIPKMAKIHVGKKMVISLDIKDFFHSIKQNSLLEFFQSIGFEEKPARTLSELCTYKYYVPQGALTSPKISNIIAARTFGPLINNYCTANKFQLSIYADDITISADEWSESVAQIIATVSEMVERFGFRINRQKTKVMKWYQRQYVCGVVVNSKVNLLRKERLQLRAIVHNVCKNGMEAEAAKNDLTANEFVSKLKGRLNWFKQLNSQQADKLISKLTARLKEFDSIEKEGLQGPHVIEGFTLKSGDELRDIPWATNSGAETGDEESTTRVPVSP